MSPSSAFVPALSISHRTTFLTGNQQRPPTTIHVCRSTRVIPRMATPPLEELTQIVTLLATKADIGPFTNVDIESAGLVAAIAGGSLIAALIAVVIARF